MVPVLFLDGPMRGVRHVVDIKYMYCQFTQLTPPSKSMDPSCTSATYRVKQARIRANPWMYFNAYVATCVKEETPVPAGCDWVLEMLPPPSFLDKFDFWWRWAVHKHAPQALEQWEIMGTQYWVTKAVRQGGSVSLGEGISDKWLDVLDFK